MTMLLMTLSDPQPPKPPNFFAFFVTYHALSYGVKNAKIGAVDPEIFDEIRQFFGHVIPDVHK